METRRRMSSPHENPLEARIARLERMVEEIHQRLPAAAAAAPADVQAPAAAPALAAEPPARAFPPLYPEPVAYDDDLPRRRPAEPLIHDEIAALFRWDSQTWLNRLGIAMLLLGVGLLFRYSIDRGWLTNEVRVGFGAAVGAVLTAIGLRMDRERRFSAVLLGGGLAAFYITGWAAFNLYALVPYTVAFIALVAITAAASGLALWRSEPALAVLGSAGGLGVPLLLGISYASPRGLAAYTSMILAWTAVPYLRRGWRSTVWTANAFAWTLLALYANWLPDTFRAGPAGRGWIQAAALFAWIVLGVLPLARRVGNWFSGSHARHAERRWTGLDSLHWYAIALLPPSMLLVVTGLTWRMQPERLGLMAIGAAAVYGVAAAAVRARDLRLARVLLVSAAALLPVGCLGALDGAVLLASLAAQMLALHWLALRGAGPAARWMAHKLFVAAGLWTLYRLAFPGEASAGRVLADVAVAAAVFASSYAIRVRTEVSVYRIFAHVVVMGIVLREVALRPGGQGIATILWCAYGLGLLLLAARRGSAALERLAILTLLATVAKLFLVDLARLDALFRVLIFLGFGAVFLWLSYSMAGWWRPAAAPEPAPRPAGHDG
jgi:uncharacterized membrane protein